MADHLINKGLNVVEDYLKRVSDMWDQALPCEGWAIVQVSPRKVLVLKQRDDGKGVIGDMRMPLRYDVVETCPNVYTAQRYIRTKFPK